MDFILLTFTVLMLVCVRGEEDECPTLRNTYQMISHEGKCYQFYFGDKTWKAAKGYCLQKKGRLAQVDNQEIFNFLKTKLNQMHWNSEHIWIGLHDMDTEGRWYWVAKSGDQEENMVWSNWASDYPHGAGFWHGSKDCVYMSKDEGSWKWKDARCNNAAFSSYRFICEYDIPDISTTEPSLLTSMETEPHSESTIETKTVPITNGITTAKVTDKQVSFSSGTDKPINGKVNGFDKQKKESIGGIPVYVVVLAFLAGLCIAIGFAAFIIIRRRKREHKTEMDEVYLTTTLPRNSNVCEYGRCASSDSTACRTPSTGNNFENLLTCSERNTIPNNYASASDLSIKPIDKDEQHVQFSEDNSQAKYSCCADGTNTGAICHDTLNKEDSACAQNKSNARQEPFACNNSLMLTGSLTRGKLPDVPTDGGYEIPVNLKGNGTYPEHPLQQSDICSGEAPVDSTEPSTDIALTSDNPTGDEKDHSVYDEIPAGTCGTDEDVYQSIP